MPEHTHRPGPRFEGRGRKGKTPFERALFYLPASVREVRVSDPLDGTPRLVAFQSDGTIYIYNRSRERFFPVEKSVLLEESPYQELIQHVDATAKREGVHPHDVARRLLALVNAATV